MKKLIIALLFVALQINLAFAVEIGIPVSATGCMSRLTCDSKNLNKYGSCTRYLVIACDGKAIAVEKDALENYTNLNSFVVSEFVKNHFRVVSCGEAMTTDVLATTCTFVREGQG